MNPLFFDSVGERGARCFAFPAMAVSAGFLRVDRIPSLRAREFERRGFRPATPALRGGIEIVGTMSETSSASGQPARTRSRPLGGPFEFVVTSTDPTPTESLRCARSDTALLP